MGRALRYDGLLPNILDKNGKVSMEPLTFEKVAEIRDYVRQHLPEGKPYDIVVEGKTDGADKAAGRELVRRWEEAGATWWIEALWEAPEQAEVFKRIQQGPPG